jgi:hypothetical protein
MKSTFVAGSTTYLRRVTWVIEYLSQVTNRERIREEFATEEEAFRAAANLGLDRTVIVKEIRLP